MCNVSFHFYRNNIEMKTASLEERCHMGGLHDMIGYMFAHNVLYSLFNEVLPLKGGVPPLLEFELAY